MIENEPMPADNEPEWPTKEEWYAEQDCDEEWIREWTNQPSS